MNARCVPNHPQLLVCVLAVASFVLTGEIRSDETQKSVGVTAGRKTRRVRLTRFSFFHMPSTVRSGAKEERLGEAKFGEMLLDAATGRCVYRLWFDGIHERADLGRFDKITSENDKYTPEQYRTVLKGAAGSDGTCYWAAWFSDDKLNNQGHSRALAVCENMRAVRDNDSPTGPSDVGVGWYNNAPLHEFVHAVGAESFDGDELRRKLSKYRYAHEQAGGRFGVSMKPDDYSGDRKNWPRWSYAASITRGRVGIRELEFRSGGRTGVWGKPVPPSFKIILDEDVDLDAEEFKKLTDWHVHVDTETAVTEY